MATAVLLNDTTDWYHWGCTATSLGLKSLISEYYTLIGAIPAAVTYGELREGPINDLQFNDPSFFDHHRRQNEPVYRLIAAADHVFVNGEGTIHGLSKPATALLYMARAAKVFLGRRVYVVNHSFFPPASENVAGFYKSVYSSFDYAAVREVASKSIVDRLGIRAELSFDCLPMYLSGRFRVQVPSDRRIVLAGSVNVTNTAIPVLREMIDRMHRRGYEVIVLTGARAAPAADDERFVASLREHGQDGWTHVAAASLDQWVDVIATAGVLVSGRFHHSLAAYTMGTPFVMLTSNTPKMQGVSAMLGTQPPIDYGDRNLLTRLTDSIDEAMVKGRPEASTHRARVSKLVDLARRNLPPLSA